MDLVKQLIEQMQMFGVSTQRVLLTETGMSLYDGGLQQYFFENYDSSAYLRNALKYCEENTVYVLEDCFGLHHYSFLLPPHLTQSDEKEMILIGPFLTETREELLPRVSKELQFTVYQESALQEFYYGTPLVEHAEALEDLIFLQVSYICALPGRPNVYRIGDWYGQGLKPKRMLEEETLQLSMETVEELYREEEELMKAITVGDTERAFTAHKKLSARHLKFDAAGSTLRNAKNMMLSSNTLYRKAVQAAAVHPIHIDKISRTFAGRIEECVFVKELEDLAHEMIRKYCLLVRNHSLLGYSQLVRDTLNYIDCNIKEPITLKLLADMNNVSIGHLSSQFKKEVGKSIVDYINDKRIYTSLFYLVTTDMTIAEVAEQVGINDDNYFSRLFKKYQNQTPKQYRNLMQSKI